MHARLRLTQAVRRALEEEEEEEADKESLRLTVISAAPPPVKKGVIKKNSLNFSPLFPVTRISFYGSFNLLRSSITFFNRHKSSAHHSAARAMESTGRVRAGKR